MKSVIITLCTVLLLAACGQEAEEGTPSADAKKTEPLADVAKETKEAETTTPEPAAKPEPMAEVAEETEMAETTAPEPAETPEPMAEVAEETEEAASEADATETVVEEVEETVVEETTVERTPSLPGAKVFFIMPKDGATVRSPVAIQFGVEGMDIAPAGQDDVHSGHHHLLIDGKLQDYNTPIPSDDTHRHYGGGQTETAIGLEPGEHTLQLILGDHNHIPHDPAVESEVITITVE